MKIIINSEIISTKKIYKEGEEYEVEKKIAEKWCSKGWASKIQKKKSFKDADLNNDGVIDEKEFDQIEKKNKE